MCQMLHDIIYWILGILLDCLMVRHVLIEISFLYVTVQQRGESEKLHPTVPKTESKIDPTRAPPTTPHGRFENVFPVWRENFQRSFKFEVEVERLGSYFWREFRLLLTNFLWLGWRNCLANECTNTYSK